MKEMPTDFVECKDDAERIKHLQYLADSKSLEILHLRKELDKCNKAIMKQSQK